jgi:Lysozyme like domain
MGNLTPAQIAQYAANAGFTGNDLLTAVDIALAESSGNPQAYNPETAAGAPAGQGSFGLWQIFLAMHPEFAGENLYDPQTNANAAYSIYAIAGGFTPWSSYTSGVYGMYESPTVLAAVAPFGGPVPTVAPAAPLTLDAATGVPVQTAAILPGVSPSLLAAEPSLTDILILGALGIAALWFIAEAA